MITNDSLDNYLFIRHQLFRIGISKEAHNIPQLHAWNKTTIEDDFGKNTWQNIRQIKNPMDMESDLKDLYIKYLERKVYKWDQLI